MKSDPCTSLLYHDLMKRCLTANSLYSCRLLSASTGYSGFGVANPRRNLQPTPSGPVRHRPSGRPAWWIDRSGPRRGAAGRSWRSHGELSQIRLARQAGALPEGLVLGDAARLPDRTTGRAPARWGHVRVDDGRSQAFLSKALGRRIHSLLSCPRMKRHHVSSAPMTGAASTCRRRASYVGCSTLARASI